MEQIAIIVPTRSRVAEFARLKQTWLETTSKKSILCPIVDNDQLDDYAEHIKGTNWLPADAAPPLSSVEKINHAAGILNKNYPIIGFISDDFMIHTQGWEEKIIDWQLQHKGICYCNDLLQSQNLPTAVFIHSDIIKALGYMGLPALKHYYVDNYWLDIGTRLKKLKYFHDIIIEHRHWSNGKSEKDQLYHQTENSLWTRDAAQWADYILTKEGDKEITKIIKYDSCRTS
jgi:hypothetical protein